MIRKSFGRSLSFPVPNSNPKLKGKGSTSLPCRFDPFISKLDDEIHDLWAHQAQSRPDSSAWILSGLEKLDRLHSSLDDLLQHPQALDSLRRRPNWTANALDDFLKFADAYGSLRSVIVELGDRRSATEAAIRRNDAGKISSAMRSQRKAEKELIRIAAAAKNAGRWESPQAAEEEAELAGVMREVAATTAGTTAALAAAFADLSAASCGMAPSGAGMCGSLGSCVVGPILMRVGPTKRSREGEDNKWRGEVLERLEELEGCIGEVEKRSEGLFRRMVNTRVFLLNILTPSL